MRLPTTLALIACAAALLVGCGDSGETTTSAPIGPGATEWVRSTWEANPDCAHPQGASRWGCSVGPYRCQAVVTDRGWSVSCARPGRAIGFTVPPRN
jgi:type IV pilus biogenesis protein CpaD/CtpE